MSKELPASAQRVQQALNAFGASFRVQTLPDTTRTAQEAARAIGCTVGQIAKSLLFRGAKTAKPILVIASGANRVSEKTLERLTGEPIEKPDAEFVREASGFAIGGIPPLGFPRPIETWIDADLLQYTEVWAAAGTPNAVFSLNPTSLTTITGGTVTTLAE
jgi:prolyl-tRNA editing enzyme YbaK/EbsC (Cys-tRNA(Pro) deacylase)